MKLEVDTKLLPNKKLCFVKVNNGERLFYTTQYSHNTDEDVAYELAAQVRGYTNEKPLLEVQYVIDKLIKAADRKREMKEDFE